MRAKDKSVALKTLAKEIFQGLQQVAECMDKGSGNALYIKAIEQFYSSVESVENTYSAQMLDAMRRDNLSYYQYIKTLSSKYCKFYTENEKCETTACVIYDEVERSILRQKELESSDEKDFATFLKDYFNTTYP